MGQNGYELHIIDVCLVHYIHYIIFCTLSMLKFNNNNKKQLQK